MKYKYNVFLQIVIFLGVVIASYFLGGSKTGNNVSILRFITSAGVLLSFGSVILSFRLEVGPRNRELAIFIFTGAVIAALAAANLESAKNYSQTFDIMRVSATFSLLISVLQFWQLKSK